MKYEAKISTADLGGDDRYLMYVSTDKPVYREGETFYLRIVLLNAKDNTPCVDRANDPLTINIQSSRGDSVYESTVNSCDSSAGFEWTIPADMPGGQYTAVVNSHMLGAPRAQRSFDIRAYRSPRLKTQIEFLREGYGPGDQVNAIVKVSRAEGGFPDGAKVSVVARVDGHEVFNKAGYEVAADGICQAAFPLPESIATGDGSLSFVIEDGGVVETATRTIPILLQTLEINFYPEGGDLVADLSTRVYIQANRPDGKPADIQGRIVELVDGKPTGVEASSVRTVHEGRGIFSLLPDRDTAYALLIDSPCGITRHFVLPEVKNSGGVIMGVRQTYKYDDAIEIYAAATADTPVAQITLHKREVLIDSFHAQASVVPPVRRCIEEYYAFDGKDSEGVLIVTAWDAAGRPLAERLIYREPRFAVNVQINVADGPLVPGASVTLDILTTDENARPVEAVVGISVTDDAVLEMIEKREQAPRLPVMVYLENEVEDLADAHVYLDADNDQAAEAVDLLLGTQGWRRFILLEYAQIKAAHPECADQVLANKQADSVLLDGGSIDFDYVASAMPVAAGIPQDWDDDTVFSAGDPDGEPEGDYDFISGTPFVEPTSVYRGPPDEPAPVDVWVQPDAYSTLGDSWDEPVAESDQSAVVVSYADDFALDPFADEEVLLEEDFLNEQLAMSTVLQPANYVREYAHRVRDNRKPNDRTDFTETLYWNAGVHTDLRTGKAQLNFDLSDSVTTFRVMADAFCRNGALGSNDLLINSVEAFYIEPKMPLMVTAGDVIELPVALVNASSEDIETVSLLARGEGLDIDQVDGVSISAGERIRKIVRIVARSPGVFTLNLSAAAGEYTDTVTRTLTVRPCGFPVALNYAGLIDAESDFNQKITLPDAIEPGSLMAQMKVYPSPIASMEEALNALLCEPCGCFEQTSSATYPLIMVLQYFISHEGIDPDKIVKTGQLLNQGYNKLLSYESSSYGYECFGGDPGHEALTAYALMEFVDMSQVMSVDESMVTRTRNWLLERRDGKGGFKRSDNSQYKFGYAPELTTTAYIIWALLESDVDAGLLQLEIDGLKEQTFKTNDSYVMALAANIFYISGDNDAAITLSTRLIKALNKAGSADNASTSITCSGGEALELETTSLVLLALLKDNDRWGAQIEVSMKWLFEQSKAGRFGSTQSTALALKVINIYDALSATPKQAGSVQLFVDDRPFGAPVVFEKDTKGVIALPDFSAAIMPVATSSSHSTGLKMTKGSKMPFALEIVYNTPLPVSSDGCELALQTRFCNAEVTEGEPVEMAIELQTANKNVPTPVVITGIPAGLEVRHEQLKELVDANRIDAYEVIDNELVLYWRGLKAKDKCVIPVMFNAAIPGTYTGAASCAYLYYTAELKIWTAGQKVTVNAR